MSSRGKKWKGSQFAQGKTSEYNEDLKLIK